MEPRRLAIAVVLMAVVLVITPILFPTPPSGPTTGVPPADSAAVAASGAAMSGAASIGDEVATPAAAQQATATPGVTEGAAVTMMAVPDSLVPRPVVIDTAAVETPLATYRVSSLGASLVSAEMQNYRALTDRGRKTDAPVEFAREGDRLLAWRMVFPGGDTLNLTRTPFEVEASDRDGRRQLRYTAQVAERAVAITYSFLPDSYRVNVAATVTGPNSDGYLLVDLPPGFRSSEADSSEDQTHLSYAFKPEGRSADLVNFRDLDPGERFLKQGPFTWVVAKNKYFLLGVLTPEAQPGFVELDVTGGPLTGKQATRADGHIVVNLRNGAAALEVYAGPQEFRRMVAMGREFETSNPYGGFMQKIIQPFATLVIKTLLWMKETAGLSYGWVLVIFGVAVRIILWPVNQRAMKTSLQMQQIQPEIQAVQAKHKGDPQKMQQEVMKVYADHGLSPFSSLTGCLPMFIPLPVFFALFFVFQNTIEFRGVPFLWLPDISLKDPYYILPIVVALTAFLVSWIGLRSTPDNPQARLMTFLLPAIMLIFFINFASGLNLYYGVQNLASLPQQWLIAKERAKMKPRVSGTPVAVAPKGGGPPRDGRGPKRLS
jgi:YidC/Oxa1 family membrane protein insertase